MSSARLSMSSELHVRWPLLLMTVRLGVLFFSVAQSIITEYVTDLTCMQMFIFLKPDSYRRPNWGPIFHSVISGVNFINLDLGKANAVTQLGGVGRYL